MNPDQFESTRHFQLWRVNVSHSQLLLRSNPAFDGDIRTEVLFKGVTAIKILNSMDGLSIRLANQAEQKEITAEVGSQPTGSSCYVITCRDFSGYVVGSLFMTDQADRGYAEPSSLLIE